MLVNVISRVSSKGIVGIMIKEEKIKKERKRKMWGIYIKSTCKKG
jgi:hypothetical protein